MTAHVVNIVLLAAVIVGALAAVVGRARRRSRDRQRREQERELLLSTLLSAGNPADPSADPVRGTAATPTSIDATTLEVLIDLIEDRRPRPRGVVAGLLASPGTVWAGGYRAGRRLAGAADAATADRYSAPVAGNE